MYQRLAFRFYWRAEKLMTPRLRSSQYTYYETLRDFMRRGARWLDMGCGHQVFGSWMEREQAEVISSSKTVVGIDMDWIGLRAHPGISKKVYGDLSSLPVRSQSFDVVSANMVMEHVSDPERLLSEVHRVLAPGGCFIFHTPSYLHWATQVSAVLPDGVKKKMIRLLDGRHQHDVFPTHYKLNTANDIRTHARRAGFEVVDLKFVSSSAALVMLGPIVLIELAFIRFLEFHKCAQLRSNLVAVLRKP
jgi:ubiquinone/menaquinone biosynthesis C-methylase UbiE